jgi:hypothetical protein
VQSTVRNRSFGDGKRREEAEKQRRLRESEKREDKIAELDKTREEVAIRRAKDHASRMREEQQRQELQRQELQRQEHELEQELQHQERKREREHHLREEREREREHQLRKERERQELRQREEVERRDRERQELRQREEVERRDRERKKAIAQRELDRQAEKFRREEEEKVLNEALEAAKLHEQKKLDRLADECRVKECLKIIADCRYYLPVFGPNSFTGNVELLAYHILLMEDIGMGIFKCYANWAITQDLPVYSDLSACFQKDFHVTGEIPSLFRGDSPSTFSLVILSKVIIDVGICCFRIRALIEPDFVDESPSPNALHNLNFNFGAIYKKCMLKSYSFQLLQAYSCLENPLLLQLIDSVCNFENFVESTLFPCFRSCFPIPTLPSPPFEDWDHDITGKEKVNDACITSWLIPTPMPPCLPPLTPRKLHYTACEVPIKNFIFKSSFSLKHLRSVLRSVTPFLSSPARAHDVALFKHPSFMNHAFSSSVYPLELANSISQHLKDTLELITESSQRVSSGEVLLVKFDHAFATLLFDQKYLLAFLSKFPSTIAHPCKFQGSHLFKVRQGTSSRIIP